MRLHSAFPNEQIAAVAVLLLLQLCKLSTAFTADDFKNDPVAALFGGMDSILQSTKSCVTKTFNVLLKGQAQRFSQEQLALMCAKSEQWTTKAKNRPENDGVSLTESQRKWLQGVRTCNDLRSCFCSIGGTTICSGLEKVENFTNGAIDGITKLNFTEGIDDIRSATHVDQIGDSVKQGFGNIFGTNHQSSTGNNSSNQQQSRRTKRQALGPLKPAVRKEYRAMSDIERNAFHQALLRLKNEKIDGISKYDLLVQFHSPEQAPGAHFGAAFLPWHRELLRQLEVALRIYDPNVGIPYWDSTLDEALPDAKQSVLWSDRFLGNGKGLVNVGPFVQWTTLTPAQGFTELKIARDVGGSQLGSLYKPSDITDVLSRKAYPDLTMCIDPFFELVHGAVHVWVGGYMADIPISPNDPVFFLHHNYIDLIWEQFRTQRQTAQQREQDYPPDAQACNQYHYSNSSMLPFNGKVNKDGLSNSYTQQFYQFAPSPTCQAPSFDCGSVNLFCWKPQSRCLSKIQLGGNCTGFEGTDICYQSTCTAGSCQAQNGGQSTLLSPTMTSPLLPPITSTVHIDSSTFTLPVATSTLSTSATVPFIQTTATGIDNQPIITTTLSGWDTATFPTVNVTSQPLQTTTVSQITFSSTAQPNPFTNSPTQSHIDFNATSPVLLSTETTISPPINQPATTQFPFESTNATQPIIEPTNIISTATVSPIPISPTDSNIVSSLPIGTTTFPISNNSSSSDINKFPLPTTVAPTQQTGHKYPVYTRTPGQYPVYTRLSSRYPVYSSSPSHLTYSVQSSSAATPAPYQTTTAVNYIPTSSTAMPPPSTKESYLSTTTAIPYVATTPSSNVVYTTSAIPPPPSSASPTSNVYQTTATILNIPVDNNEDIKINKPVNDNRTKKGCTAFSNNKFILFCAISLTLYLVV